MARVTLGGTLRSLAGDTPAIEVEATTIREVLDRVAEAYPKVRPLLDRVAVAVDGQIYRNQWFAPVKPDSEVYILPPMAGG
jgi:molybdopterin converting factor small subunit